MVDNADAAAFGRRRMTWRLTPIEGVAVVLVAMAASVFLIPKILRMLKVCLFSPVKGIVVYKGQPVVGAVIERTCEWNWKKYEPQTDQTETDEKGEFSLPGMYSWMGLVQLVPHEPVIHQHVVIKYEGKEYNAWYLVKHEYGEFAELDMAKVFGDGPSLEGKPINLYCDLEAEAKNRGGYGGLSVLR